VKFIVTIRSQATLDAESVKRLVAHELGHVLGIAQHSKRQTDLLYPGPITRSEPSPADRATLQVLYHTRAYITP
jgi:predicted Zn-dependent protease